MSHGASLLGHGHPTVKQAVQRALDLGILCIFDTEHHVALAEKLVQLIPCADMVRFTNSGTEATLHALRLCRAYTGKKKVIRFLGHFHGYHEYVFVGGHPPREALGNPSAYVESEGIPKEMCEFALSIPAGDAALSEETLQKQGGEVAAVILEPVNYNNGCITYAKESLTQLRTLTREHDQPLCPSGITFPDSPNIIAANTSP